jgi:glucose-6-phosphate 1-epimerase
MSTTYFFDWQRKLEIPGRVTFLEGNGGLPKIEVATAVATAEIYQQGAHVTHFQRKDERPLLFLSQVSQFERGHPIRGGIPVIYPWVGARDSQGAHGFARTQAWELWEISNLPNGSVRLQFRLPESPEAALYPAALVNYSVTVGETLICELTVTNHSAEQLLEFENCLHTYFLVGDIARVSVVGLQGAEYLDKMADFAMRRQGPEPIRITGETDRVYLDAPGPVEIIDQSLRRKIRVETTGSHSTVVWNPWIEKSQRLPDFGNDEYLRMICVESGNVARNQIKLPPGQASALRVKLISNPL